MRRDLLAYASAGAALAAGGDGAAAGIIYNDFPDATMDANSPPFSLDIDGNRTADFEFTFDNDFLISGLWGNAIGPFPNTNGCPCGPSAGVPSGWMTRANLTNYGGGGWTNGFSLIPTGYPIDGAMSFAQSGHFLQPGSGFLGLRFNLGGAVQFGWVRIAVPDWTHLTVFDAAYETQPGQGIATGTVPEPGSLGLLALGAAGVSLRRRRVPDQ